MVELRPCCRENGHSGSNTSMLTSAAFSATSTNLSNIVGTNGNVFYHTTDLASNIVRVRLNKQY